jgi:multisubunit Na+/H+ antiporter MnhB subunit
MNFTFLQQRDKQLHVAAGALVSLVTTLVLQLPFPLFADILSTFAVVLGAASAPGVGFVASVIAGAAKEAVDFVVNAYREAHGKPQTHDVDPLDFLATALGGLFVAVPITMLVLA